MQTALRAAVVALLSHPPLCLKMEAEAQAGISGLICNEQWKYTSTYMSEIRYVMKETILQMRTDRTSQHFGQKYVLFKHVLIIIRVL
jgi:hypothetical protein